MYPNLKVGDYLFVSKFSYGFSRHSLPFSLPLLPNRVFYKEPQRGDVIVFKTPEDNRTDYIKRLIGLPGDKISIESNEILLMEKKSKERLKKMKNINFSMYKRLKKLFQTKII